MQLRHDDDGEIINRAVLGDPMDFEDYQWQLELANRKTSKTSNSLKMKREEKSIQEQRKASKAERALRLNDQMKLSATDQSPTQVANIPNLNLMK